uniref:Transmembrane protein 255B n=1 Tax=Aotus nancymaae TaxID=37293 RepID=A0A2K5D935_AOTNA
CLPGPLEGLARRKKTSLWFVGSLLLVSVLIVTIGLAATTRTENVTVGGYYPGIILGFGSFLGIIGVNLVENRRQMLVAAIVFISFGVVAAFCCAIVDGVFAARHIEPRPLVTGRCQFYSSGVGYLYDVYQTEVSGSTELHAGFAQLSPPTPCGLPCASAWSDSSCMSLLWLASRRWPCMFWGLDTLMCCISLSARALDLPL